MIGRKEIEIEPLENESKKYILNELNEIFDNKVFGNIRFLSEDRKWSYAIMFTKKIKARDIIKIQRFIFKKYTLSNYEILPDITGEHVFFVFDLLEHGGFIG